MNPKDRRTLARLADEPLPSKRWNSRISMPKTSSGPLAAKGRGARSAFHETHEAILKERRAAEVELSLPPRRST